MKHQSNIYLGLFRKVIEKLRWGCSPDAKRAICWRCGSWESCSSSRIPCRLSSGPSSFSIARCVPPSTCAISSRTCCTRVSANGAVPRRKCPSGQRTPSHDYRPPEPAAITLFAHTFTAWTFHFTVKQDLCNEKRLARLILLRIAIIAIERWSRVLLLC